MGGEGHCGMGGEDCVMCRKGIVGEKGKIVGRKGEDCVMSGRGL